MVKVQLESLVFMNRQLQLNVKSENTNSMDSLSQKNVCTQSMRNINLMKKGFENLLEYLEFT